MSPATETRAVQESRPPTAVKRAEGSFLHSTIGASVILSAWVFVLGWTYLHVYYAYFGININSLDFPVYHYMTFFFAQFVSFGWRGVYLGTLILAAFFLAWAGEGARSWIAGLFVGLGFLLLFWLGFHVAESNATEAARQDMSMASTLPQVEIEFKQQSALVNGDVQTLLNSPNLRLVLEDDTHLFVFVPVDLTKASALVNTVSVERSQVSCTLRTVRVK
jgi:hypothetical protein